MSAKRDKIIEYIGHINSSFNTHPSLDFFVDEIMNELSETHLKSRYIAAVAYKVCAILDDLERQKRGISGNIVKEKLGEQEVHYSDNIPNKNKTNSYYWNRYYELINKFGGFTYG